MTSPLRATWRTEHAVLSVHEPALDEIERVSPLLSAWYSDDYNRQMTGTPSLYSPEQAVAFHRDERQAGGRTFFFCCDGRLVGDMAIVRMHPPTAEMGIMIGDRVDQGKGLGTSLSIVGHALAFRALPLDAFYGSVVAGNPAALRCHGKVGYVVDDSPFARSFADADDEVCLRLTRADFERRHARILGQIVFEGMPR